ncbi:MAG: BMP family ABC transporter substrate-binding protein [Candidatus Eisenbacteria bacterium]
MRHATRGGWLRGLGWALLAGAVLPLGCGGGGEKAPARPFHVGMVFDVGGLGDKSFNDLAYQGLLQAREKLGVSFEYFEPTQSSDREAALRLYAQGGADLIVGVGFLFTDDINAVAADFPAQRFVCVDYSWSEGQAIPPNVVGLKFREEEGAFLVGALAAMVSKSGTLGFIGGMDIPLIHKFEAGYRAGVQHVSPAARVLVNYAGVTGDAFKNPAKGKELALSQYDQGADIIFHASGSTGLGVFEAAREGDRLVIGVDADQSGEAPGHVLTSMIKRVDRAVGDEIAQALEGRFTSGVRVFGLKEGGVDYVRSQPWLTPEREARLDQITRQIAAGEIRVPAE